MARRHKSMRERITIKEPVYVEDSYGQQAIDDYALVAGLENLPASFEATGGTETFRGRQLEANIEGVFELRLPSVAVTPKMLVEHVSDGGKQYDIASARPAEGEYEGGFRKLWIFVKALADV